MIKHPKHSGILHFKSFQRFANLSHFTTTREGGCSSGSFGSFNLGRYSGDADSCVRENRASLCEAIGIAGYALYVPHQSHGTEIAFVERDFTEASAEQQTTWLEGKDALLSSQKGVCIAVSTADCVPILLYAEATEVVGAVHAGWRGTYGRILSKTVEAMISRYGCTPQEIHVAIGPSISQEAFEVGNEVYDAFSANGFDMGAIAAKHPHTAKYHIDLWEANRLQLLALGVTAHQIQLSGVCTYTQADTYFSARRLGIASGRMLTGICMKG